MTTLNLMLKLIWDGIIFFFAAAIAYRLHKEGHLRLRTYFAAYSFFYIMLILLEGYLLADPSQTLNLLLLDSLFLVARTTILFLIFHSFIKKKHIIYLLLIYLFTVFSLQYSFQKFFYALIAISYLLLFILFFQVKQSFHLERVGRYGMFFALTSMLSLFLDYYHYDISVLFLFTNLFLGLALYYFFLFIGNWDIKPIRSQVSLSPIKIMLLVAKLFILMIVIVSVMMIAVVAVHELGHSLTAKALGCSWTKAVIHDTHDLPHVELRCQLTSDQLVMVALAGLIFPLVMGFLLLIFGERSTIGYAYLIIGFSFYYAFDDLSRLLLPSSMRFLLLLLTLLFLFFGNKELLDYYYHEELELYHTGFSLR